MWQIDRRVCRGFGILRKEQKQKEEHDCGKPGHVDATDQSVLRTFAEHGSDAKLIAPSVEKEAGEVTPVTMVPESDSSCLARRLIAALATGAVTGPTVRSPVRV